MTFQFTPGQNKGYSQDHIKLLKRMYSDGLHLDLFIDRVLTPDHAGQIQSQQQNQFLGTSSQFQVALYM